MSIKKKYLKNNKVCKVTFRVPKKAANGAKKIHVVGDFNGWDEKANPMKNLKNGDFTAIIELETDREYQFRYLLNQKIWENDWSADKYVPTEFGDSDNSVVIV